MRSIQKFAAINVMAALIGAGIPAMAAQNGYDNHNRGGMQHQSADHRGNGEWRDSRNRDSRDNQRRDYDHRDNDRRDYDRRVDTRGYGYGYEAAPVYQAAPIYTGPVYDNGYYDRSHNGRTAAIIGGSVAAGALIGAAAGHGQGAVIGAVVGGIAGAVASTAADHHRY